MLFIPDRTRCFNRLAGPHFNPLLFLCPFPFYSLPLLFPFSSSSLNLHCPFPFFLFLFPFSSYSLFLRILLDSKFSSAVSESEPLGIRSHHFLLYSPAHSPSSDHPRPLITTSASPIYHFHQLVNVICLSTYVKTLLPGSRKADMLILTASSASPIYHLPSIFTPKWKEFVLMSFDLGQDPVARINKICMKIRLNILCLIITSKLSCEIHK